LGKSGDGGVNIASVKAKENPSLLKTKSIDKY
jgi:hypothetical protein